MLTRKTIQTPGFVAALALLSNPPPVTPADEPEEKEPVINFHLPDAAPAGIPTGKTAGVPEQTETTLPINP